MTCAKRYSCDLCEDTIAEATDGIGIRWNSGNTINAVFYADSEHHLCNRCIEGLKSMLERLAADKEMYRKLDAESAAEAAR